MAGYELIMKCIWTFRFLVTMPRKEQSDMLNDIVCSGAWSSECTISSGRFIWGYYYSWNLKLNLFRYSLCANAITSWIPWKRKTETTPNQNRYTVDVNVSAFYSLVFRTVVTLYGCFLSSLFLVVYQWKVIEVLSTRSIPKQSTMGYNNEESLPEWCSQANVCYMDLAFRAFHTNFIGSFHDYRWEGVRCTQSVEQFLFWWVQW